MHGDRLEQEQCKPAVFARAQHHEREYWIDPSLGISLAKAQSRFPGREFYTTQVGKETAMSMKV